MKFHFDITPEEYLQLHAFHIKHSWDGYRVARVWRMFGPVAMVIALVVLYQFGLNSYWLIGAAVVLALVSYLWMRNSAKLMLKFQQSNVRRLMKKGIKFYDAEGEIEFGDEEVLQDCGENKRSVKYGDISVVTEDGEIIFIRYSGSQYMLIPKRCLGRQFGTLKGLLERKGVKVEKA